MKNSRKLHKSFVSLGSFFLFFIIIAFTTACCFFLFLRNVDIPEDTIRENAMFTFLNIWGLSFILTFIAELYRRITVERPLKRILAATEQIMSGDFTAQISEKGYTRNEMELIIKNFNRMAKELSGIETLRTDFIANVSHELKTPLAVIQSYAVLLQAPDLSEEDRKHYTKTITAAARRLSDLVTNILKLNKLENQHIIPEKKEFNLSEQLCEAFLNFEEVWEKKSIEIKTDIAEDVVICSDSELLFLVWNNLFSNAFKFTDNGGTVSLTLKDMGGSVVVRVSDTGCGIGEGEILHIFEKFYQADRSHSTQGNGLGLALVKRIVDLLGAAVEVESELGVGTVFCVTIRKE